jgi:hypothetical protein
LHRHRLSAHMIRPPPKRRRPLDDPPPETLLQRLVHVGGVSSRGLLELLEELRATHAEGLPDTLPHTQHGIGETIHARFDAMSVELDMPLIVGDGVFKWPLVDPNQLVARSIDFSSTLHDVFSDAVRLNPPSMTNPWSLVVGFDEFVPGNKFKIDNRRKCMNLHFSFKELGQHALCNELAWFTPVCIRTSILHKCRGGWSHFLRMYLWTHLLGPTGIATAGVPIMISGRPILLFAKLTNLLSDGDGLRMAFDWKGASSMKPCFKHYNVFKKDTLCLLLLFPMF